MAIQRDDDGPQLARERTLRARPREARHAEGPSYVAPRVVTTAMCSRAKAHGCTGTVSITAEGLEALESCSRQLERRGEQPLDLNACFLCDGCVAVRDRVLSERAADRAARSAEAIQFCKNATSEDLDHAWRCVQANMGGRMGPGTSASLQLAAEHLEHLRKAIGASYVRELLSCLRERSTGGKAKPRRDLLS